MTVISRTSKTDWATAGLIKKNLAWRLKNNINGIYDDAIEKETALLWSFLKAA